MKKELTGNSSTVTERTIFSELFHLQVRYNVTGVSEDTVFKTAKNGEKPGPRGPGLYQHFQTTKELPGLSTDIGGRIKV